MGIQTKTIGRVTTDHGPYDPDLAYGKKFQCELFGCVWESLHDNNNTAPAVWDGGDTITPNLVDWKKQSGSYESWLMNRDKPASTGTTGDYPYNGLGRIVLKKKYSENSDYANQPILEQSDFDDENNNHLTNTVFVIKYDFVLTEDITLGSGCVLEFEGGSIIGDGTDKDTIIANKSLVIKSDVKCFSGIKFSGYCRDNFYHTKWFTTPSNYNDKTYDHTTELQSLFNSGVRNIVFDGGFYYVTETLVINSGIDLYADTADNNVFAQKVDHSNAAVPTIYSDVIVTILDYEFYAADTNRRSLYIGAIHVICDKHYTEVTQQSTETPIVKIHSMSMMWRADIYMSVFAPYCSIVTPNGNFNAVNYTGIELYADEGYMTCIRLMGDIVRTYNGYRAFTSTKPLVWFTAIDLSGYTDCVRAIDTDVSPLTISGTHQANTALEIFGPEGYFSSTGGIIDNGAFVFDLAHGGAPINDRNVLYKTYTEDLYTGDRHYGVNCFDGGRRRKTAEKFKQGNAVQYIELADKTFSNILSLLVSADDDISLFDWSYKINNTNISEFTGGTIYNIDKLFVRDLKYDGKDYEYTSRFEDSAYIVFSEVNQVQSIEFTFKTSWPYLEYMLLTNDILYKIGSGSATCILNIMDANDNVVSSVNMNGAANSGFFSRANLLNFFNDYDSPVNIKFTVTYTESPKRFGLPFFAVTCWKNLRAVDSLNSTFRLPNIATGLRKGFNYFDTTFNKPIYWTGTAWVDATGNSPV